jgi:hypothetical protein
LIDPSARCGNTTPGAFLLVNPSEEFADWTMLRTIRVQAVATWMLRDVFNRLTRLEKSIRGELVMAGVSGETTPAEQRRALKAFAEAISEKIAEVYREILSRVEEDFQTLAEKEDEAQRLMFAKFGALKPGQPFDAGKLAILGVSVADWFGKQAGDLEFRINQAVRQGVDAGESEAELQKRVKGGISKDEIPIPRPLDTSERAAEVILRTGVTTVQSEVTDELADKLPASVDYGWQQISILDNRTTQICRAYAFKLWTKDFKPIGHGLPFNGGVPRHPNCRSRIVLYMLDDGPTKELTFKAWMDNLSATDQAQIFGKSRVELWKAGKLTDQDLIRQQWRAIAPANINEQ